MNDAGRVARWARELELFRSGPLVVVDGVLWLLCGPERLAPDPSTAAVLLSSRASVDPVLLGRSLGVRATVLVDDAQLARWWRGLALLRANQRKAEKLARDGVAGVKQFRRDGIESLLASAEQRLSFLRGAVDGAVSGAGLIIDGSPLGSEVAAGLERRLRPLCGEHSGRVVTEVLRDGVVDSNTLALRLLYPASMLQWPAAEPRFDLLAVARAAGSLERCSQLWPVVCSMGSRSGPVALAASGHPVAYVELLASRGLERLGEIHAGDRRRSRALAVVAEWFAPLCEESELLRESLEAKDWEPVLLVAVLLWHQRSKARLDPRGWEQLLVVLRKTASPVGRALRRWATPIAQPDPAVASTLEGAGFDRTDLARYVHYRALLGEPTGLPAPLRNLLARVQREEGEARWLRERLASDGVEQAERARLGARLALLSGAAAAGRAEAAGRAARRSLSRSTRELADRALRALLDDALVELASERFGLVLEAPLVPAARHALLLLDRVHPGSVDDRRLAGLVGALQRGDVEGSQPGNDRWLLAAARRGIDVDGWRQGVEVRVRVLGEDLTVLTERDPLEVLRMGSYFGTCLDVREGMNGLSLVANVLDVNKAVVYVRRTNGNVVARKLIGLTSDGELAGFPTYAHEHPVELRRCLVGVLSDFARRIGARLSDTAKPERLGGGFWYDDGNEIWAVSAPRGDTPVDEAAIWRARRDGDTAALRALALSGAGRGAAIAAVHLSRHVDGSGQPTEVGRLDAGQQAATFRSRAGEFNAGMELSAAALSLAGFDACPFGSAAPQFGRLLAARQPRACPNNIADLVAALVMPPSVLAQVALAATKAGYPLVDLEQTWSTLPDAVALERPNMASLRRVIVGSGPLARSYGHQVPLPDCAALYRRDLTTRAGDAFDMAAMALGRIGDPNDAHALRVALRRRSYSLPAAWAATRCGVSDAAGLWAPNLTQIGPWVPGWWTSCARTVGGAVLAARLRRWMQTQFAEPALGAGALLALFNVIGEFGLESFDPTELRADVAAAVLRLGSEVDVDAPLVEARSRWERAVRLGAALREPRCLDSETVRPLWVLATGIHDPDLVLAAGQAARHGSVATVKDAIAYLTSLRWEATSMSALTLTAIASRPDAHQFTRDEQVGLAVSLFAGSRTSVPAFLIAAAVIEHLDEPVLGKLSAHAFRVTGAFDPTLCNEVRFLAADRLARASAAARSAFIEAFFGDDPLLSTPPVDQVRRACEAITYWWDPHDATRFINTAIEHFPEDIAHF